MDNSVFYASLTTVALVVACAPVQFNKQSDNVASSSIVGAPGSDDKMHTMSMDCAAGTLTFSGTVRVTDPRGFADDHQSCTPTLNFNRSFAIPLLADKVEYDLIAPTKNLVQWDAVGCDRNYFGLGFKVVCDNGKRTIARVDLKYTIGRTDESIYVYRCSYQWKVPDVGCSLINGDLSCRGDSASFELSGLLGVQK
jgi:hypothetical protein